MGVTGLWTVLQPCARPIKIETLNKKRLAVDASIWIYQFLKAVRDKEGNALRNSHIVGFFRRICKLLFIGIKPVFVFDGGAPALKRQTISNRKSRREGHREDAVRTASKLLALQMQRLAEEEDEKRKNKSGHPREEEETLPDNLVYVEELQMTPEQRQKNRKFKKKDQYHLPELDASLAEMGGPNDPRIMSLEELEHYARQFDTGEDINVYDFSKIDFDSPFFISLPAVDRYNILNAARLRSRLRMGYSKEQLDNMFPDRMAFSKFQIERVTERNDLTQRLMNINGMADDTMFGINGASRVAGEKGREYVLVKNDGVEGGWALGVVTNKDEGVESKPIDVDKLPEPINVDEDDWESEDELEDVPIEGLNRLPESLRLPSTTQQSENGLTTRPRRPYAPAPKGASKSRKQKDSSNDPESLFVADEVEDEEWENVDIGHGADDLSEEAPGENDDEELQLAIAMSLNKDESHGETNPEKDEEDDCLEVFQQQRVEEPKPLPRGSGLAIARTANMRSSKLALRGPTSDSDDDGIDFQAALAESRKSKRPPAAGLHQAKKDDSLRPSQAASSPAQSAKAPGFDGPLPFEKLDLGTSLLGKKKMKKIEEANAGGFEKEPDNVKDKSEPLPPWFSGDLQEDLAAQREIEKEERWRDQKALEEEYQFQNPLRLRTQDTLEVIYLEDSQPQSQQVVTIESSEEEKESNIEMEDVLGWDSPLRMADQAEKSRTHLLPPLLEGKEIPNQQASLAQRTIPDSHKDAEDEAIDWSESGGEDNGATQSPRKATDQPSKSPSLDFEDVMIEGAQTSSILAETLPQVNEETLSGPSHVSGLADDNAPLEIPDDDDSSVYSDPEDAELFASLAEEAEEHARFASTLNSAAAPIDFDQELKQLRSQQKKDRRDADEVTQTMIAECQHLLTLFGLPYITAPMEAEAQCAELVTLGLVDGIVTDDSDTFLFGGTRVYKNMFNAAKFVECYLLSDLTTEFALTREKLIAIAQLLGSDYTVGIPGIGPVTALEILSEFGTLHAFKDWWSGVQTGATPRDADSGNQWRRRFRRTNTAKLFLPPGFPDPRVVEAYMKPAVDDDPQGFQWGVPNLDALRSFLSSQIGWSAERTDEVLVPVIRDMNRREKEGTQANITRFFEGTVGAGAFAPRVRDGPTARGKGKGAAGKRIGRALDKLAERERGRDVGEIVYGDRAGDENGATHEDAAEQTTSNGRAKRKKGKAPSRQDRGSASNEEDNDDLYAEPPRKARKNANGGARGRSKGNGKSKA
jgi:DNA excision repair protein ERCC-5